MHLKRAMKYFFEHACVQKTKKLFYRSDSNMNNDDDENNIRKIHECTYVCRAAAVFSMELAIYPISLIPNL